MNWKDMNGYWLCEDDSEIHVLDEPYHGPMRGLYALFVGNPPTLWDEYGSLEEAKAGHKEWVEEGPRPQRDRWNRY